MQKLLLLLFVLLLSACGLREPTVQSTPPRDTQPLETLALIRIELNEPFVLIAGQRGQLDAAGLTLEFQTVLRDWRCPSQVECSEAGAVEIAIYAWLTGLEPTRFELNTNPPLQQEATPYDDYEIRLLDVEPYPETPEQSIPLEDYRVTLVVSLKSALDDSPKP